MIFGGANLACANMAAQPFPAQFHAIVIPAIPWIPAHSWLAYVTGTALLFGGLFLGCALILHVPRMVVVPQNWGLRGEVGEMAQPGAT